MTIAELFNNVPQLPKDLLQAHACHPPSSQTLINNNAQDQQSYTSRPVATAVSLEKREFGSLKLFPKV